VLIYAKRFARCLKVCPECGHHARLSARERISHLVDTDSFAEVDLADLTDGGSGWDPLAFHDRKSYVSRRADAARASGEYDAAVFGSATVGGRNVVVAVMDFGFMGGSMGTAVGEAIACAAEEAHRTRTPLLLVTSSGGARMQEGCLSLMQMAKTSQAIARLREDDVLCICILTDPTFGGVTASFAVLGHVVIAESGALIGFAGPRVIEGTIRQKLPTGFQTAEFLLAHGMVDRVEPRAGLRPLVERLLRLHRPANPLRAHPPRRLPARVPTRSMPTGRDPWDVVQAARDTARPTALDYIGLVFDDFCELHGDRCFGDDPSIVGGPARLGDRTVMVLGHQKGHDTRDLVARNFGMPHPEGYRKVRRLMAHAAAFGMPVVTLVDTPGAFPGVEAEERGQSVAIAECILAAARLPVPIVSVVIGEGGSGGALALATADRVLMSENAYYSVISPEGCAAILWGTRQEAPAAARALRLTARDLVELGIVDAVVPEPLGGAHTDPHAAAGYLERVLHDSLDSLAPLAAANPAALIEARYARYREYGRQSLRPEQIEESA
jgi:acetyl-CoA carboxylase carboxyl transferase subunit beta